MNLKIPDSRRLPLKVVTFKNVDKAYNDIVVFKNLNIVLERNNKIGLVGYNGAGKTTLLRMLIGELQPDEGIIRSGAKVEIVSLDQRREILASDMSLSDVLTGGGSDMVFVGDQQRHVVSYMKDFLFQPEQARTVVSALSGGERGRLMLALSLIHI